MDAEDWARSAIIKYSQKHHPQTFKIILGDIGRRRIQKLIDFGCISIILA